MVNLGLFFNHMLFCFTLYGHGGHFGQVTQNKYHIYKFLFTEYSI